MNYTLKIDKMKIKNYLEYSILLRGFEDLGPRGWLNKLVFFYQRHPWKIIYKWVDSRNNSIAIK